MYYNDLEIYESLGLNRIQTIVAIESAKHSLNTKWNDEWYYLTESDGVVTIFDKIFDKLWCVVYPYLNKPLPSKGYIIPIPTKYSYKSVYDKNTHTKDIELDYYNKHNTGSNTISDSDNNWHHLFFGVTDSNQRLISNGKMAVVRATTYNYSDAIDNNDDIYILINKDEIPNEKEFRKCLRHELTHIAEISTLALIDCNQFDENGKPRIGKNVNGRNKLGEHIIIFDDNDVLTKMSFYICNDIYMFSPYEENSFLGEMHQVIMDFTDNEIALIERECTSNDERIRMIIDLTAPSNRYLDMDVCYNRFKTIKIDNLDGIVSILLYALYLKVQGNVNYDYKYVDENFIENYYISGDINIMDVADIKRLKKDIFKRLTYRKDMYLEVLKTRAFKSYMQRLGRY